MYFLDFILLICLTYVILRRRKKNRAQVIYMEK